MSAIVNPRDLALQGAPARRVPITLPDNILIPGLVDMTPDGTLPPPPTNLVATGSFTHVTITTGAPVFTVGHGYGRTNVYMAVRGPGFESPTFSNATYAGSFIGAVGSISVPAATSVSIWATWVSRDGAESLPAGGTNGRPTQTGLEVERIIGALTGPGQPYKEVPVSFTLPDGTFVPAGTYTADAFIHNGQIVNAMIRNLAVDDAKIFSANVSKLTAGSLQVGSFISSSNYVGSTSGFAIWADGAAEFNNVSIRGGIYATYGLIGGNLITAGGVYSPNFVSGVSGWGMDSSGGAQFNSITLRGAIMGGNFTGYAWPSNGGGGFYLGPPGLLLGNANTGQYFQLTDGGALYAPGVSIVGGVLTINQANVIDTLNIKGEAVTMPRAGRLAGDFTTDSLLVTLPYTVFGTGTAVTLIAFGTGPGGFTSDNSETGTGGSASPNVYYIFRDETIIQAFASGTTTMVVDYPGGNGGATYSLRVAHGSGQHGNGWTTAASFCALGCKR